jgi:RimJ/RimL family protein N-acetyltransferase
MQGRFCRLEIYERERRLQELFDAYAEDDGRMWTYLPWGPFKDVEAFEQLMLRTAELFQRFVIIDAASGRVLGDASYMRHDQDMGSVEVGGVTFGPRLRRTPAATEAMYLMMRRAFETGYRRYEWRCDALNAPSRAAALRLGFRYEGLFRQERVYKGRNRDTAWFSIIDSEWPALDRAMQAWLDPANFDAQGSQRTPLSDLIARERGMGDGC